jgi:hypothetical protein
MKSLKVIAYVLLDLEENATLQLLEGTRPAHTSLHAFVLGLALILLHRG